MRPSQWQARPTWPVMHTMGEESIIAVAMPVTRLVAPGPLVAIATPTAPRRPGIAIRHVRCALLVPHQHMMNLRVLGHGIVGWQEIAPPG